MREVNYFGEPFLLEAVTLPSGEAAPILKDRAAIVTGGGKGIGKGISLRLAAAGAKLLIVGCGNMAMAEETAGQIRAMGGECHTLKADLALEESAYAIRDEAVRLFGKLDILVSNAALQPNLDADEYPSALFRQVEEVNLWSPVRLVSACIPLLEQSPCGRIIVVSSVHGKRTSGFDVAYAASKGGLQMLVREAAAELCAKRITVNAILPGGTNVEFKSGVTRSIHHLAVERERTYAPNYRSGNPGDTGNLAVYLASDLGAHITGVSIRTDGGLLMF